MLTVIPHEIPFVVGDCLFDSISFAMSASEIDVSSVELRKHVAKKAINPAFEEVRSFWRDMYANGDAELKEQFRFAKPILSNDLDQLYTNMLDANLYWGDDFALQRLSDKYRCRILVLNRSHSVAVTNPTRPKRATTLILLQLKNSHYEPLELCDTFVQLI